ncbi:multifunctional 2',3'-cyclic-nucleotide 2'-phosphodiesterase/5'-nucleotidase/3'-nucleotidase [Rubellimicrobium rubrum]|uniref:Multifunctional 2',3'-cyclic-nucleotide 2'-phosphodiesterase/5'-nucleotidase/3'-nucleotidase n=1 Tax=Rubellimicrobium rubrum TaxID=2585369 RepID=A0A5C4N5X7_9RHOB|nr:bifunctional metallophosphatase/5'-nucleotidase [Rubellimicrobium rubrum]TNC52049.1 multifunctional 2',3'-cyclic-nucleotide 2'-phosphodiesterase/5'-nucleotidase/3'-nucleotidase [Rubellimicrobium rubrum]
MSLRLWLSTAGAALVATQACADFTLTILHTNDFHDRFEPINATDSACDEEQAAANECFGGIARLITAVSEARGRAENSILLDAGDQFQGSLLYTQYKGDMSAEFMPQLGYQAMAVGNHEFDDGPAVLGEFIDAVGLPVLSANIDPSQEPALAGKIAKSTVIEVGGERIGVVGLTTVETPEIASPGPNVNFLPYDAAQQEIDDLTEQGINKIVLLSHAGYVEDQALAQSLTGVDVIVGGHSHTLLSNTEEGAAGPYPTMVNDVPIVQARSYGKYLGELTVTFDDQGSVISAEGDPILLDASIAEDEAAKARVAELGAPLEELRARVVAETSDAVDGERESCRAVECEMGNLVAEAMLARVADQGVTIAIANGGGLRASIDAGPVTMGEVLTVLPFQNTLSTFQTDGQTIIEALENGASQIEEQGGRFAQVAGLRYTIDPSQPAGSRVSDVQALLGGDAWAPIDPAATYGVVTNNYVRTGGDGYAMFVDAEDAYDFGPDLADVTAEYLAANQPYTPFVDGRITVVGAAVPASEAVAPSAVETPDDGTAAEAAPAAEGGATEAAPAEAEPATP